MPKLWSTRTSVGLDLGVYLRVFTFWLLHQLIKGRLLLVGSLHVKINPISPTLGYRLWPMLVGPGTVGVDPGTCFFGPYLPPTAQGYAPPKGTHELYFETVCF